MSESKQRWRLVFARDDEARFLSHLDAVHLWERAFRRGEIPVATSEGFSPRPRLIFAAPLPLGMLAEHELADLFLAERLTRPDLRSRLSDGMPRGYRLIDLHDEWVGGPALATRLVAADYRLTLLGISPERLAPAAGALLAAASLPREKRREKRVTAYDLRPLLLDLQVREDEVAAGAADGVGVPAAGLWMRLRNSQEMGSGRAEEVVAALADELGLATAAAAREEETPQTETPKDERGPAEARVLTPEVQDAVAPVVEMVRPVRERLWLAEELALRDAEGRPTAASRLPFRV
jgi:radical SAM-linked protein